TQERGFARTAGTEDCERLAVGQLQIHVIKRGVPVEPHDPARHLQHQNVPRSRTRIRSIVKITVALSTMRTVASANDCPTFSAPGRVKNRSIAIGSVGVFGRAMN